MFGFEGIYGRERLVSGLTAQIRNGKTSHAYIFDGERSSGKKSLANAFARVMLCESRTGCGRCKSCITFDSGNNPDVIRLSPEEGKTIGIDSVREQINATAFIRPYLYDSKIYIIEEADKLTPQAQNAFLKTLEDAPGYCVFILICGNTMLMLPTVLSRCRLIRLSPLPEGTVAACLSERLGLSTDTALFYARLSGGNIGKALELAGSESFNKLRGFVTRRVLHKIREKDIIELFGLAKAFEEFRDSIGLALDIMLLWYRDLIICRELGPDAVLQKDLTELISENAEDGLDKMPEYIADTRLKLSQNTPFQLTLEVLLLRLAGAVQNAPPQADFISEDIGV